MDQEKGRADFKKSYRGYSVDEVNRFVEESSRDIESLRGEIADLYKKLAAANDEIDKYHREEAVRGDIIKEAKANADGILNDAKSRAARVIIRTSRQCNRIVADMVSQVEEQKNIYENTKREVLKFRGDLFSLYKDHITKINAYAEAAGAFETDALSKSELDSFIKLLGDEPDADAEDSYYVGTKIEKEVETIINGSAKDTESEARNEPETASSAPVPEVMPEPEPEAETEPEIEAEHEIEAEPAVETEPEADAEFEAKSEPRIPEETGLKDQEEVYTFDAPAEPVSPDDSGELIMSDEIPEPAGDTIDDNSGEYFPEIPKSASPVADDQLDLKEAIGEDEDIGDEFEFVPEALGEEPSDEFEAPEIDLEDTDEFGEEGEIANAVSEFDGPVSINDVFGTLSSYDDADFEAVYGESDWEEKDKKPAAPTEEELLERRRRAEDDSNEFYDTSDIEFDPLADPVSPTSQTGPMFDTIEKPKMRKRRWKIKRSMSITDEFKAVKSEEDND